MLSTIPSKVEALTQPTSSQALKFRAPGAAGSLLLTFTVQKCLHLLRQFSSLPTWKLQPAFLVGEKARLPPLSSSAPGPLATVSFLPLCSAPGWICAFVAVLLNCHHSVLSSDRRASFPWKSFVARYTKHTIPDIPLASWDVAWSKLFSALDSALFATRICHQPGVSWLLGPCAGSKLVRQWLGSLHTEGNKVQMFTWLGKGGHPVTV